MGKSSQEYRYLFGPVPSRRLGLSLGVDIIPFKTCPLDCVYCQLGRTKVKTTERREYVPIAEVLDELRRRLAEGLEADHVTLSGSGEPTLHSRLGELIKQIKQLTSIPVAVLTNGALFNHEDVRAQCVSADVVLPSLDAGDDETFRRVNRPCSDISIENVICGLSSFRDQFEAQIWLEVFLVEGLNTAPEQLAKIKAGIERIRPDKVQLNTAVRPTADNNVRGLAPEQLQLIAERLGDNCEIIAGYARGYGGKHVGRGAEQVLAMLKRRPCSLQDVCNGLGLHPNEALKYIGILKEQGRVKSVQKNGMTFFTA